jgi:hypothetical protein
VLEVRASVLFADASKRWPQAALFVIVSMSFVIARGARDIFGFHLLDLL